MNGTWQNLFRNEVIDNFQQKLKYPLNSEDFCVLFRIINCGKSVMEDVYVFRKNKSAEKGLTAEKLRWENYPAFKPNL